MSLAENGRIQNCLRYLGMLKILLIGGKTQVYLRYWARYPTSETPGKYHVGFILCPKTPKDIRKKVAMLYHAVNRVNPDTGEQTWASEARATEPRTLMLVGCILLGKMSMNLQVQDITRILGHVRVPSMEEADIKDWRCRHWVIEALELLEKRGVIPQLPGSACEVWKNGKVFVESMTGGFPDHKVALYTCATSGRGILSEIAALQ